MGRFQLALSQIVGKRLTYRGGHWQGGRNAFLIRILRSVGSGSPNVFFRCFARFSASSFALISECGTTTSRRIKFVNWPKSPVTFFAGLFGHSASVPSTRRKDAVVRHKSQLPPSVALDALVCGYAPRWRAEKKFAIMNQGFSDHSMSGEGEKTLLLAGCVSEYRMSADFCFAWEAALASEPSINYFKMREARQLIKEFDGWNAPDRDDKIKLLARVIHRFSLT